VFLLLCSVLLFVAGKSVVFFKKRGGRSILGWFAPFFCYLGLVLGLFCFSGWGIFSVLIAFARI
jgi:hypothetical protein